MAAATPAVAASPTFNPLANLEVGVLGGAEGRYETGSNFTPSGAVWPPNRDFRRAFRVTNTSTDGASFSGTLRVNFQYPGMWNNPSFVNGQSQGDEVAFNKLGTVDLGGRSGGSIGGKTDWTTTVNTEPWWVNTQGPNAWTAVHMRMDYAYVDLTNVSLPAGSTVWFALNAEVPSKWIREADDYLPNRIYWRSPVSITATATGGTDPLGTYHTPVGSLAEGIWYFNGGGPVAYLGGEGLYPVYPTP